MHAWGPEAWPACLRGGAVRTRPELMTGETGEGGAACARMGIRRATPELLRVVGVGLVVTKRAMPTTRMCRSARLPRGQGYVEPLSTTGEMTAVVAEMMKMARPTAGTRHPSRPLRGHVDVESPTAIRDTARRRNGEGKDGPVRTACPMVGANCRGILTGGCETTDSTG